MFQYNIPAHWVFAAQLGPKCPFYEDPLQLEFWLKENLPKSCSSLSCEIPFLTLSSTDYPNALKGPKAPPVLFYRGNLDLLKKHIIGAVGTRYCSTQGLQYARLLSSYLAENHLPSISGLAQGIDNMVHRHARGCTIGVLPCGFHKIPNSLAMQCEYIIERGGLILSEFLPTSPPRKWRYIQRNRIIAWLSEVVILIVNNMAHI